MRIWEQTPFLEVHLARLKPDFWSPKPSHSPKWGFYYLFSIKSNISIWKCLPSVKANNLSLLKALLSSLPFTPRRKFPWPECAVCLQVAFRGDCLADWVMLIRREDFETSQIFIKKIYRYLVFITACWYNCHIRLPKK